MYPDVLPAQRWHGSDHSAAAAVTEAPTIEWDGLDPHAWDALLALAGRSPLEQSWAYGAALTGTKVRRGVISRSGNVQGLVQIFERRIGPFSLAQILRGPVWLAGAPDTQAMAALKSQHRIAKGTLLLWTPELTDSEASTSLMRSIGRRRMTTGYSSTWLDLAQDEQTLRAGMHGKWRNALRLAEKSDPPVSVSHDGSDISWILGRADAHRRKVRYAGPSSKFLNALIDAGADVVTLRCEDDSGPMAGIVLLRHGAAWSYLVGWTDPAGRRLNAHNLLLWRAMVELKRRGVRWLDLGGINAAAPGVARFKLGLGGEFYTLAGTYI